VRCCHYDPRNGRTTNCRPDMEQNRHVSWDPDPAESSDVYDHNSRRFASIRERHLTDLPVSRGRPLTKHAEAEPFPDLSTNTNQRLPLKRPRPRVHGLVRQSRRRRSRQLALATSVPASEHERWPRPHHRTINLSRTEASADPDDPA
jgi:hypothetical protein